LRRWEVLNKEYANKGLHFFTAYAQSHPLATMEAQIKNLGLTLPVATDGYYKSRFTAGVLCVIWVIGVDGKVVHVGQEGWEVAALRELKKVRYPGLGMNTVGAPLEAAAKAFGEGKLAEADKLAEAVEGGDFEEGVLTDAGKIRERVRERRKLLENRADTAEVCTDYDLSLACWSELAARFGEIADERSPKEEIARINKLADLEPERKARKAFIDARQKAWAAFDNLGNDAKKIDAACDKAIKQMEEFIAANKDRHPVEAARLLIEDWKAWKEELKPEPAESKPGDKK
jgi:hypothetical protein